MAVIKEKEARVFLAPQPMFTRGPRLAAYFPANYRTTALKWPVKTLSRTSRSSLWSIYLSISKLNQPCLNHRVPD